MDKTKPLGHKSYGSIPHLQGSRLGPGDYCISDGQAKIATVKTRDRHDTVIVQEKLDGSNMSVAKLNGKILPLTRAGYLATDSPYRQHHFFAKWVNKNSIRFEELLQENERICGEWLVMAHGTRYALPHEPFVAFDLMHNTNRAVYDEFHTRVNRFDFVVPRLIYQGSAFSVEDAIWATWASGHGAIDPVEGAVWRVERKGKVDFLCKYVNHDKQDGKYFPERTGKEEVWNCDITEWI